MTIFLNGNNSGCRVRGARDSGLTYSDKDVEFGNYQIPENWDQEAVVEALTKVCISKLAFLKSSRVRCFISRVMAGSI